MPKISTRKIFSPPPRTLLWTAFFFFFFCQGHLFPQGKINNIMYTKTRLFLAHSLHTLLIYFFHGIILCNTYKELCFFHTRKFATTKIDITPTIYISAVCLMKKNGEILIFLQQKIEFSTIFKVNTYLLIPEPSRS